MAAYAGRNTQYAVRNSVGVSDELPPPDPRLPQERRRHRGHDPPAGAGTATSPCDQPRQADVVIVNTCGFIDIAKDESLEALRDGRAAQAPGPGAHRRRLPGRALRRTGLQRQAPVGGRGAGHAALGADPGAGGGAGVRATPPARGRPTPPAPPGPRPSAYLKIADGCDSSCAFCVIPQIKGPYQQQAAERGRSPRRGDLAARGRPGARAGGPGHHRSTAATWALRDGLADAAGARCWPRRPACPGWRIMYAYPQHITPRLIAGHGRQRPAVCRYLDLPLQHAHPDTSASAWAAPRNVDRPSASSAGCARPCPTSPCAARSSSATPARPRRSSPRCWPSCARCAWTAPASSPTRRRRARRPRPCRARCRQRIKRARFGRAMAVQQGVSLASNQEWVGKTLDVLIEGRAGGQDRAAALRRRAYRDAPEVDGMVLVRPAPGAAEPRRSVDRSRAHHQRHGV